MNLHEIITRGDLWLLRATSEDRDAMVWFVEAHSREEAMRAFDVLGQIHDYGEIYSTEIDQIRPGWIKTPDAVIDELKMDWDYVFEDEEDEEDDEEDE